MSYGINFESSRVKDSSREETRQAREAVLGKVKADYERKVAREKQNDTKWMLPSVEARLESGSKSKKHKKTKKKKKKKRSNKTDSDSESESNEDEWVEKSDSTSTSGKANETLPKVTKVEEPTARDEWMSLPGLFPCVTKERKQPEKRKDQDKLMLDTMGQSERELNPYWKGGGSGLPSEDKFEKKMKDVLTPAGTVGDLGADWLRRALTRAKEQAAEQGRSLEAVAAERWGSLEKLKTLLAEAEARASRPRPVQGGYSQSRHSYDRNEPRQYDKYKQQQDRDRRERDLNDMTDCSREDKKQGDDKSHPGDRDRSSRRQREDISDERSSGHSSDRSRTFQSPRDGEDRGTKRRKEKMSDERSSDHSSDQSRTFQRPRDEEDGDAKRRREKMSDERSSDHSSDRSRMFQRPRDEEDRDAKRRREKMSDERSSGQANDRSRSFQRPRGDEDGRDTERRREKALDEKNSDHSGDRSQSFQRPRGGDDEERNLSDRFRKPTDNDKQSSYSTSSRQNNWRKKEPIDDKREPPKKPKSSSSSSESEEEVRTEPSEPTKPTESTVRLTEREMNDLGAKLIKAEIMGNQALATELKRKLDEANAIRATDPVVSTAGPSENEVVILTRTDARGLTRPVPAATEPTGGRRRKVKAPTHDKEGKRVRYFADDDTPTLQEMFQSEKLNTVEDSNEMFSKLAGKVKPNDDMADLFEEQVSRQESAGRREARERSQAIGEFKRSERALESCHRCFDSKLMLKHLVIAIGTKVYVCLPSHESLTDGHCLILPLHHVPCATQLDEDVWTEVQSFRRALTAMFLKMDQDVVYIETAMRLRHFPHMAIECIPMPTETGHMAPIYFKKAILECETEWSTNRKLVDTMGKDVRRAIPKGLPYFSVDFGNEGGFAHVIEDESLFPKNFAQEIVGGMLDLDHNLWRKPRRENFTAQRKKVLEFAKWWKPFDFTHKSSDSNSSSSSSSD